MDGQSKRPVKVVFSNITSARQILSKAKNLTLIRQLKTVNMCALTGIWRNKDFKKKLYSSWRRTKLNCHNSNIISEMEWFAPWVYTLSVFMYFFDAYQFFFKKWYMYVILIIMSWLWAPITVKYELMLFLK